MHAKSASRLSLFQNETILRIIHLCTVVTLFLISLWNPLFLYFAFALALCAVVYDTIKELIDRQLGSGLFFLIASAISIFAQEIHAITIVLIIVLVASVINHFIEERTEAAIANLFELMPQETTQVMPDGSYKNVSVKALKVGDHLVIKPGKKIPVDGIIIQGEAGINEIMLTGESTPHTKRIHEVVFAGTHVVHGSIIVKTTKIGHETELGKIQMLIQEAHEHKGYMVSTAAKVAWYVTICLILLITITWIITGDVRLVTTLLVFGSPVELTLITPLSILAAIAAAFKNGIVVKGGAILETLAKSDTMIFDKTGTLTMGEPYITTIVTYAPNVTQQDIVFYASIAEKRSGHTIAKAVLKKAADLHLSIPEPDSFTSITGHGISITYNNDRYITGNRHFISSPEHGNIQMPIDDKQSSSTIIYLAKNNTLLGSLTVEDVIRHEAKKMIDDLKKSGIKTLMIISGDKQTIADKVGIQLGIKESLGEVMPEEKMNIVKSLQAQNKLVVMVGDGINDAPALKQANVGIAIGAMGTEVAIQSADIVLISNNIHLIYFTRILAQKTVRIIKQNIIWGLVCTHGLGIILSFLRILNPVQAALFHAIPELIILLNTARILWFKP